MIDKQLLNSHAERLQYFLRCWHAGGVPGAGVSAEAAAYYLLEHAAMLWRYTGDEEVIAGLKDLESTERARLVRDACAFVQGIHLVNTCRQLLGARDPDHEQVHLLGDVLKNRDELETALTLAHEVAGELIHRDGEVLQALADARVRLGELDQALEAHPDVTALACRELQDTFARIAPTVRQGLNLRRYWWFDASGQGTGSPDGNGEQQEPAWLRVVREFIACFRLRPGPVAGATETPEVAVLRGQLEDARATVTGDAEVSLAFDLVPWPADPTRMQWRIWVNGPTGARQRYAAVVVRLHGTDRPLRASLAAPGLALIPVDQEAQRLLAGGLGSVRLVLVDRNGAEHSVE